MAMTAAPGVRLPPYPENPSDDDHLQRFSVDVLRSALQLRHLCPSVDIEGIHGTCPTTTTKMRSVAIIRAVLWPPDHTGNPKRLSLSWLKEAVSLNSIGGDVERSPASPAPPLGVRLPPAQARSSAAMWAAVVHSSAAARPSRVRRSTPTRTAQAMQLHRPYPALDSPSSASSSSSMLMPPLLPVATFASSSSSSSQLPVLADPASNGAARVLSTAFFTSPLSSHSPSTDDSSRRRGRHKRRQREGEERKEEREDREGREREGKEEMEGLGRPEGAEQAEKEEQVDTDTEERRDRDEDVKDIGRVLAAHRAQQMREARQVLDSAYRSLSEWWRQLDADYALVLAEEERVRASEQWMRQSRAELHRTTEVVGRLQEQNQGLLEAMTTFVSNERRLMMEGMKEAVHGEVVQQLSVMTDITADKAGGFWKIIHKLRVELESAQTELAELKAEAQAQG